MLEVLTAPSTIVFSAALLLMIVIGIIEAVGLGLAGAEIDLGIETSDGGVLAWLGVGRVPLLILLIAFLALFGMIGLIGQQVATAIRGEAAPMWLAIPGAIALALPATRLAARGLARVMPHDETTAVEWGDLVGLAGVIVVGRATAGSPARSRVIDRHGQPHHVQVEPNDPAECFETGDTVRLVRREGDIFRAILDQSPRHTDWMTA